jgi:hypothetical protein
MRFPFLFVAGFGVAQAYHKPGFESSGTADFTITTYLHDDQTGLIMLFAELADAAEKCAVDHAFACSPAQIAGDIAEKKKSADIPHGSPRNRKKIHTCRNSGIWTKKEQRSCLGALREYSIYPSNAFDYGS